VKRSTQLVPDTVMTQPAERGSASGSYSNASPFVSLYLATKQYLASEEFTLLTNSVELSAFREAVQPLYRFTAIYGTRRLITEFTSPLHLYLL
jgi:hypothetical protein